VTNSEYLGSTQSEKSQVRRHWLQVKFLVPIVAMMLGIVLAVALMVNYFNSHTQHRSLIHERVAQTRNLAERMLDQGINLDTNAIQSIIYSITRNEKVTDLFKSRDRAAVLAYAEPLFNKLHDQFQITHFYFHLPDRINFLRVQAPAIHGDKINRLTTVLAQETDHLTSGIEMGVLGTLTLRVVYPWHDATGKLIGYLELGKEIDHVVEEMQASIGMDVHLLLHKTNSENGASS